MLVCRGALGAAKPWVRSGQRCNCTAIWHVNDFTKCNSISEETAQYNYTSCRVSVRLRLTPTDARRGTSISQSFTTRSHASLGLMPLPTQYINSFQQGYANTINTIPLFRLPRADMLGIVRLQEWIPVLGILPATVSWTIKRRVRPQIFHWAVIRQCVDRTEVAPRRP